MTLIGIATRIGDCRLKMKEAAQDLARSATLLAGQVDLAAPVAAQIAEARMMQVLAWGQYAGAVAELDKLLMLNRALEAGSRVGAAAGD